MPRIVSASGSGISHGGSAVTPAMLDGHMAPALVAVLDKGAGVAAVYSTVTVLARLRGWSTLRPRRRAIR
jgi:hypothetical protein